MNLFNEKNKERINKLIAAPIYPDTEKESKEEPEEWIWVTGYKGMIDDMTCRDHQYELGKQYDLPEEETVKDCYCGFHFCRDLADVFDYYPIGRGNRYFQVSGLVRKKDYDEYGIMFPSHNIARNKLAAKSIFINRELTIEEIVDGCIQNANMQDADLKSWSIEDWKMAIKFGVSVVRHRHIVKRLVDLGYSETFSEFIAQRGRAVNIAEAVASQPGVSMDVKVFTIMNAFRCK